ncbi:MAG TPA: protease complex subunit PrcB family protein [Armatimonadota bacterium]|nr:protease complex subunit PrcB family protein [Armatimonadota bacterium]
MPLPSLRGCAVPALFFAITAALAPVPLARAAAPAVLPLRTLAAGPDCSFTKPERKVVRSAAEWKALWLRLPAVLDGRPAPPPKVDFAKETVLAVFMGRKPTAGYAVRIAEARVESGKVVVTVRERTPPPGGVAAEVLTAPYCLAAVKKSPLPVAWKTLPEQPGR